MTLIAFFSYSEGSIVISDRKSSHSDSPTPEIFKKYFKLPDTNIYIFAAGPTECIKELKSDLSGSDLLDFNEICERIIAYVRKKIGDSQFMTTVDGKFGMEFFIINKLNEGIKAYKIYNMQKSDITANEFNCIGSGAEYIHPDLQQIQLKTENLTEEKAIELAVSFLDHIAIKHSFDVGSSRTMGCDVLLFPREGNVNELNILRDNQHSKSLFVLVSELESLDMLRMENG